jgi:two-component system, OmpR family, response regulator BaeR
MTINLLIVEDEPDLAAIVADYAVAAGYAPRVIGDGRQALAAVHAQAPDLILLDLMLPGLDGIALCRAVREFSDVPIIMMTARVAEIDRLLGLETGADDYVCKPFSPQELFARIRAILRRVHRAPAAQASIIDIDETLHDVRIRGCSLDLTPTEYLLFSTMARRPGTIWSRARLLDLARPDALAVSDNTIYSHIKNLRRKIDAQLPGVEVIESVYGVGYRVELPARPSAMSSSILSHLARP